MNFQAHSPKTKDILNLRHLCNRRGCAQPYRMANAVKKFIKFRTIITSVFTLQPELQCRECATLSSISESRLQLLVNPAAAGKFMVQWSNNILHLTLYHMTKVNPLLHRYSFRRINNRQLLKTLWDKEKLLITSNFSFSHNVFYSIR